MPFASLTSSLLARRGSARPAMRRQPLGTLHAPLPINDDLGWNDLGEDQYIEPAPVTPDAVAPVSPVNEQLQQLAERINAKPKSRREKGKILALPAGRKAAFTLRIDAERHLRLRLLSAVANRSSQQLLIEALDELIARHEEARDLADQVEARRTERP